jgi:hypothetical protein
MKEQQLSIEVGLVCSVYTSGGLLRDIAALPEADGSTQVLEKRFYIKYTDNYWSR